MKHKTAPATSATKIAAYLDFQINASPKTRDEIAKEIGFERPNVLSMMRNGTMKIPLTVAPRLASALGLDRAAFLRRVLEEYIPELLEVIEAEGMGLVSKNEAEILNVIRNATKDSDPALNTKDQERRLASAAKNILMP